MSQHPDNLFRDKLRNYQRLPSSEAWNRVSQNLHKKYKRRIILKVAACALLLATATILLLPSPQHVDLRISENSTDAPVNPPAIPKLPDDRKATDVHSETKAEQQPTPTRPNEPAPEDHENHTWRPVEDPEHKTASERLSMPDPAGEPDIPIRFEQQIVMEESVRVENQADETQGIDVETDQEERKKVTIVFTADEVNRKYLTKNAETEATTGEENPSGLKKLLNKAYDLKHNQDLLGDLRQKKNEILAMNFRNEKHTTQND